MLKGEGKGVERRRRGKEWRIGKEEVEVPHGIKLQVVRDTQPGKRESVG